MQSFDVFQKNFGHNIVAIFVAFFFVAFFCVFFSVRHFWPLPFRIVQPIAKKPPTRDGFCIQEAQIRLLDLAFFIFNVLARDGIIFPNDHFLGHCARILFGHIEVACVCGRVQTNFDCGRLRHFIYSVQAAAGSAALRNPEARLLTVGRGLSTAIRVQKTCADGL